MNETYRFYNGLLDNEKFICSCDIDDLMGEPMVGDMVELPINADIGDQDLYIDLRNPSVQPSTPRRLTLIG